MPNTKVPIELSSTPGIIDNSTVTAITIDSDEDMTAVEAAISAGNGYTAS